MLILGESRDRVCGNSLSYSFNIFVSLKLCQNKSEKKTGTVTKEEAIYMMSDTERGRVTAGADAVQSLRSISKTCNKAIHVFNLSFQIEVTMRQSLHKAVLDHIETQVSLSSNPVC